MTPAQCRAARALLDWTQGSASNRQTADLGDGQPVKSVRQAAEAFFKPTIDVPPSTDEPSPPPPV